MYEQRRGREVAENEKGCMHGSLQFIWPLLLTFPLIVKKQGLFYNRNLLLKISPYSIIG